MDSPSPLPFPRDTLPFEGVAARLRLTGHVLNRFSGRELPGRNAGVSTSSVGWTSRSERDLSDSLSRNGSRASRLLGDGLLKDLTSNSLSSELRHWPVMAEFIEISEIRISDPDEWIGICSTTVGWMLVVSFIDSSISV